MYFRIDRRFQEIVNSYFDVPTSFHPVFLLKQPIQKKSALNDLVVFKRKLSG